MIKAIIFDYDGVIVDSFESLFKAYQKICKFFKVNCPTDMNNFRKIYGYNYIECFNNLGIQEKDFSKANEIYKNEMSVMKHRLFPGIAEVINELSKRYKLYLVSASFSQEILPRLKAHNLSKPFERIYCGADKKVRKSEIINSILDKYNYLPSEVISIGDRAIDYDVAKKVGLKDENIILVTYGWGLDRSRIGNSNVVDNPGDILNIFK
jgi:phosphoglycolate phosphatase